MKKQKNKSLTKLLIIRSTVIILILTFGITGINIWSTDRNVKSQMEKDGLALANSYHLVMQHLLIEAQDILAAQKYSESIVKSEGIGYALVIDSEMKAIVSDKPKEIGTVIDDENTKNAIAQNRIYMNPYLDPEDGKHYLDVFIPIKLSDGKTGVVDVGISVNEIYHGLEKGVMLSIIFAMIFTVLSTAAMYFFLYAYLKKPLEKGKQLALAIANKDLTMDVQMKHNDEIASIVNAINIAKDHLKEIISHIQQSSTGVTSASANLSESLLSVNKVMDTIADAANGMANDFSQNASSMSETYQAVTSITEESQNIAAVSNNVSEYSLEVKQAASDGQKSVEEIVDIIEDISDSQEEVKKQIQQLETAVTKIGDIVSIVNQISDQTNLLALNAAIEAARAGDAGRGFAVVAEEVRKLAEQSREALGGIEELTKDIKDKTQNVVAVGQVTGEKMHSGVSKAQLVKSKIDSIIDSIQNVTDKITRISSSVTEQAAAMQEMNATMDTINESITNGASATQEISASIEEQNSTIDEIEKTAEQLEEMAKTLDSLTHEFKL